MADLRKTIQIDVQGLNSLDSLSQKLDDVKTKIDSLRNMRFSPSFINNFDRLNTSVDNLGKSSSTATRNLQTLTQTTSQLTQSVNTASSSYSSHSLVMGKTIAQYYLLHTALKETVKLAHEVADAYKEIDKQASRTSRIADPNQRGFYGSLVGAGGVQSGRGFKDAGESLYQLGTFVKDPVTLMKAQQEQMKMLMGTEGDARESARLTIQIYEQFGSTMAKNIDQGEKFHRINELIAGSFRDSHAELGELANALKYLGPIAEAAKIPLEQVFATISALTAEGHRGRMAGTEVGQFISQLIKNGDNQYFGVDKSGKNIPLNYLARTQGGGVDLIQTLKNISEIGNKLPQAEAEKFIRTIGGTTNAFRFLGSQTEETQRLLNGFYDNAKKRTAGLTSEVENLAKEMGKTFEVQEHRAWFAFLDQSARALGTLVDKLGLIKQLKAFADASEDQDNLKNYDTAIGKKLASMPPAQNLQFMRGVAQKARAYMRAYPREAHTDMWGDVTYDSWDSLLEKQGVNPSQQERPTIWNGFGKNWKTQDEWRKQETARLSHNEILALKGVLKNTIGTDEISMQNIQKALPLMFPKGVSAGLLPAPVTGARNNFGTFKTKEQIEAEQREAQTRAEEARRTRLDALRTQQSQLETDYVVMFRRANAEGWSKEKGDSVLNPLLDKKYAVIKQIAQLEKDGGTLYAMSKGVGSVAEDRQQWSEVIKQRSQDAKDKWLTQKETMADYFDAQIDYSTRGGIRSTWAMTLGGWADALRYGQLKPEDQYRYRTGLSGQKARLMGLPNAPSLPSLMPEGWGIDIGTTPFERYQKQVNGLDGMVSGGLRSNDYQRMQLLVAQKDLAETFLSKGGTAEEIKQVKEQLDGFKNSIKALGETLEERAYNFGIRSIGDRQQNALFDADMAQNPLMEIGRNGSYNAQRAMAQRRLGIYSTTMQDRRRAVQEAVEGGYSPDVIAQRHDEFAESVKDFRRASKELSDLPKQRYANTFNEIQGQVTGSLVSVLRGKTEPLTALAGIGDTIVNKALESVIDKWTNPLVTTITNEITAMEGLTTVMNSLPGRMGNVMSGKADAPVSVKGKSGTSGGGSYNASTLGMALGGFGMFMGGVQNGNNNIGGMVGNYLGGSSLFGGLLGGLGGGLLGVGLGLLGGLFHHKPKDPLENYKNTSYALYNSPSDMLELAYRYRATGRYPTRQELGLPAMSGQPVPIVNVYVDGVKTSVTKALNQATNSQNVQLSNLNWQKAPY